jgi:branched-chain amino acid transport system ATP-binding protein/branched-chain amino acid transport system permease protein
MSIEAAPRPVISPPRPRGRAIPWRTPFGVLAAVVFVWGTYAVATGSLYTQGLVLTAAVFAILALSLDLVAGMLGLYSLGHAGLFALGAYTTTLMNVNHGWSVFLLLPVCIVGVGAVGMGLGALSLRVSGLYFAITTFVFTLVLTVVASDFSFTGGDQGLLGPLFPPFGSALSGLGKSVAWAIGAALAVTILIVVSIRRSPLYSVLLAIRDAEPRAAAAGVRTSLVKIGMFGLSAALAGMAGWCFAFLGVVSPGQFNWPVSVDILVMVILGGINTTIGPIIGAAFISMFPSWVNINPFWQEVLFGSLFVAMIILAPEGVAGLGRRVIARVAPALLVRNDRSEAVPVATPGTRAADRAATDATDSDGDAVRCRGVSFSYGGGLTAVDDVDFTVRRGTIHGLIGPNGSGKSTLVNLIAGRLRPTAGTIEIEGARVDRESAPSRARRGFTRTFQDATLVRELSARDNVAVGLYSQINAIPVRGPVWPALPGSRATARLIRGRSRGALDYVGAAEWGSARIADVPHGVEQLTQLAAAVVTGPRTLILDEPLAGLAPSEVEHVAELLAQLRGSGVSVVLIEHQPRFVFDVCDEVTVLNAGQVVASGPAAEVRANEDVRRVYLGQ